MDTPPPSLRVRTGPATLAALVGLLASPLLGGCRTPDPSAAEPSGVGPVLEVDELGGMTNVCVCGDLWLGGAPGPADLELAARRGVEMVIDLCQEGELGYDPASICGELDLEHVHLPISLTELTDERVDEVLDVLRAARGKKVLLFSRSGSDAAMIFAIHRAVEAGLDPEEALHEGRRAGMKPGVSEAVVRSQTSRLVRA